MLCSECQAEIVRRPYETDAMFKKRVTCGKQVCRQLRTKRKHREWYEKYGNPQTQTRHY